MQPKPHALEAPPAFAPPHMKAPAALGAEGDPDQARNSGALHSRVPAWQAALQFPSQAGPRTPGPSFWHPSGTEWGPYDRADWGRSGWPLAVQGPPVWDWSRQWPPVGAAGALHPSQYPGFNPERHRCVGGMPPPGGPAQGHEHGSYAERSAYSPSWAPPWPPQPGPMGYGLRMHGCDPRFAAHARTVHQPSHLSEPLGPPFGPSERGRPGMTDLLSAMDEAIATAFQDSSILESASNALDAAPANARASAASAERGQATKSAAAGVSAAPASSQPGTTASAARGSFSSRPASFEVRAPSFEATNTDAPSNVSAERSSMVGMDHLPELPPFDPATKQFVHRSGRNHPYHPQALFPVDGSSDLHPDILALLKEHDSAMQDAVLGGMIPQKAAPARSGSPSARPPAASPGLLVWRHAVRVPEFANSARYRPQAPALASEAASAPLADSNNNHGGGTDARSGSLPHVPASNAATPPHGTSLVLDTTLHPFAAHPGSRSAPEVCIPAPMKEPVLPLTTVGTGSNEARSSYTFMSHHGAAAASQGWGDSVTWWQSAESSGAGHGAHGVGASRPGDSGLKLPEGLPESWLTHDHRALMDAVWATGGADGSRDAGSRALDGSRTRKRRLAAPADDEMTLDGPIDDLSFGDDSHTRTHASGAKRGTLPQASHSDAHAPIAPHANGVSECCSGLLPASTAPIKRDGGLVVPTPLAWAPRLPDRKPCFWTAGHDEKVLERLREPEMVLPRRPKKVVDRRRTRQLNNLLGLDGEARRTMQAERNRRSAREAVERKKEEVQALSEKVSQELKARNDLVLRMIVNNVNQQERTSAQHKHGDTCAHGAGASGLVRCRSWPLLSAESRLHVKSRRDVRRYLSSGMPPALQHILDCNPNLASVVNECMSEAANSLDELTVGEDTRSTSSGPAAYSSK